MKRAALAALVFAATLGACATQLPPAPAPFDLAGSSWVLVTSATPAPTVTFTERGASGNAGCNRWFSSAQRNQQALTFGNIGTTRMACAEPQMATERAFLQALTETQGARQENGELVLYDIGGADLARFRRTN